MVEYRARMRIYLAKLKIILFFLGGRNYSLYIFLWFALLSFLSLIYRQINDNSSIKLRFLANKSKPTRSKAFFAVHFEYLQEFARERQRNFSISSNYLKPLVTNFIIEHTSYVTTYIEDFHRMLLLRNIL